MSEFEYAAMVVSIVMALGITEILRHIADTVRDLNSKPIYWVHSLWLLLLLKTHMDFWVQMWLFRELVQIGSGLVYILVGPAMLFIATRTLLPDSNSDEDMAALFYKRKNAFFAIMAIIAFWSIVSIPQQINIVIVALGILGVSLYVACIVINKPVFHKSVVLLVAALEVLEAASSFLAN